MVCSTPNTWGRILRSLVFLSAFAALASTPHTTKAQQTASQSGAAPRHPVVIAGGAYRLPAPTLPPARANVPMLVAPSVAPSRPAGSAHPVRFANPLRAPSVIDPAARPEWNSGAIFFKVPPFSAWFAGSFGLPGSVSQFGGMPLGFGLWPACDSATTPGVFWTVGPCFGLASYSPELTPTPAQPAPYLPPLTLFESEPSSGPAAAQPPSAPAPPTTMVLCVTDGSTIVATDWWITLGRLHYITGSGQTGEIDAMQLDMERTIKENQKRGLDFRLKFTPPSDVYPPSIRP
jgi:hypothetical protein